jgi:hypothetical protein
MEEIYERASRALFFLAAQNPEPVEELEMKN